MTDKSAEDLCLNVYAETLAFYKEIQPLMGHRGFGFKILYRPPLLSRQFFSSDTNLVGPPKMTRESKRVEHTNAGQPH